MKIARKYWALAIEMSLKPLENSVFTMPLKAAREYWVVAMSLKAAKNLGPTTHPTISWLHSEEKCTVS